MPDTPSNDTFLFRKDFNRAVGRPWLPLMDWELDLLDYFELYKNEGHAVLLFYGDKYDPDCGFMGLKAENPWETIRYLHAPQEHRWVMAALDLTRDFEQQWPHHAGSVTLEYLEENPVRTIPDDRSVRRVATCSGKAVPNFILGVVK